MYIIEMIKMNCKTINPNQRIIIDWEDRPYVIAGPGAPQAAGENGPGSLEVPGIEFEVARGLGESDVHPQP